MSLFDDDSLWQMKMEEDLSDDPFGLSLKEEDWLPYGFLGSDAPHDVLPDSLGTLAGLKAPMSPEDPDHYASPFLSTDLPSSPISTAFLHITPPSSEPVNPMNRFVTEHNGPWNPSNLMLPLEGEKFYPMSGPPSSFQHYPDTARPYEHAASDTESIVTGTFGGDASQDSYAESVSGMSVEPASVSTEVNEITSAMQSMQPPCDASVHSNDDDEEESEDDVNADTGEADKKGDFQCSQCTQTFRLHSELKKHSKKHDKPHTCDQSGCNRRAQGFTSYNDLERHMRTVHNIFLQSLKTVVYICASERCSDKRGKTWPRKDNFKQHLTRLHKDEDQEELMRKSRMTLEEAQHIQRRHERGVISRKEIQEASRSLVVEIQTPRGNMLFPNWSPTSPSSPGSGSMPMRVTKSEADASRTMRSQRRAARRLPPTVHGDIVTRRRHGAPPPLIHNPSQYSAPAPQTQMSPLSAGPVSPNISLNFHSSINGRQMYTYPPIVHQRQPPQHHVTQDNIAAMAQELVANCSQNPNWDLLEDELFQLFETEGNSSSPAYPTHVLQNSSAWLQSQVSMVMSLTLEQRREFLVHFSHAVHPDHPRQGSKLHCYDCAADYVRYS